MLHNITCEWALLTNTKWGSCWCIRKGEYPPLCHSVEKHWPVQSNQTNWMPVILHCCRWCCDIQHWRHHCLSLKSDTYWAYWCTKSCITQHATQASSSSCYRHTQKTLNIVQRCNSIKCFFHLFLENHSVLAQRSHTHIWEQTDQDKELQLSYFPLTATILVPFLPSVALSIPW